MQTNRFRKRVGEGLVHAVADEYAGRVEVDARRLECSRAITPGSHRLAMPKASCSNTTSLMSLVGNVPAAITNASYSMDRAVSSVRSTTTLRRPDLSTPPNGAVTNGVAPRR